MLYTDLTRKAYIIAYNAHNGQVDKSGMPYIHHPLHLAEQMKSEDACIVALLHDVVEDTNVTIEKLEEMSFPEECIVAVKPSEIVITDINRNKIYSFPLTVVASWGVNSELFVIVEKKSDKDYSKSYFYCNQPKLFKIIIDSYTNAMVGKNMVEIMTERVETCKLFESLSFTKLKPGESLRTRQATVYDL